MHGHTAHDMELVGYTDLDGQPGFKLALQVVDDRWLLYITKFWEPGIHVVDVTDPTSPRVVGEIPGPDDPNVATWQVQVADGVLVQSFEVRPVKWGGDPTRCQHEGIRLWDVSEPDRPRELSTFGWGATGTHRNHWSGGDLVHCAASVPGYDGNIYVIVDISDRTAPREVGRWFFPEQYVAGGGRAPTRYSLHGPAYPIGDRAYLPYGAAGVVVLDISDVTCPTLVSHLDTGLAFASPIAQHTANPLPGRDLLVINTEAIRELSEEPYNFAGIVDLSDESEPRLISMFPTPVPHPGADYPNFQRRGGRFGPHNQHHRQNGDPNLDQSEDVVWLTWFNGGLRVYDIRDPYLPREVGSFLPDDPTERRGLLPESALVTQSEDVLVDARGNAYVTDKNHGLHVVRFTGTL